MPAAPMIRLELMVMEYLDNPFLFESFLNGAAEDQAAVLAHFTNQDRLYLTFYGDALDYRYTRAIKHDEQQGQQSDELMIQA